jgi:hypothetical protein
LSYDNAVRIWFPLAILLSVGWLLLVSVIISRSDDGAGSTAPSAVDAATLLRQSQAAMLALESFQLKFTTQWEGRDLTYHIAWEKPDSFHAVSPYGVAHYETGQEPVVTDYGFVEWIAVGERLYTRQCAELNDDCQPWSERVRDGIYLPAPASELDPFWTIELLGLMSGPEVVGQERVDGVTCIRIQGEANVMRAMIQSWRRAEAVRGPMDYGEECSGQAEPGEETQQECHRLTLDEYISSLADSLRNQDEDPLAVEVWIGPDGLMRRLELLEGVPDEGLVAGTVTFSRFDGVTVEPPK